METSKCLFNIKSYSNFIQPLPVNVSMLLFGFITPFSKGLGAENNFVYLWFFTGLLFFAFTTTFKFVISAAEFFISFHFPKITFLLFDISLMKNTKKFSTKLLNVAGTET